MSMQQLNKVLMKQAEFGRQFRSKPHGHFFQYDYADSQQELRRKFPTAIIRGLGAMKGWEWFIDTNSLPNIRLGFYDDNFHVPVGPMPFPATSVQQYRKGPQRGIVGFVYAMSQVDLVAIEQEQIMKGRRRIYYPITLHTRSINGTISPRLALAMVFLDMANTLDGAIDLNDMDMNLRWNTAVKRIRESGMPAWYVHYIEAKLKGEETGIEPLVVRPNENPIFDPQAAERQAAFAKFRQQQRQRQQEEEEEQQQASNRRVVKFSQQQKHAMLQQILRHGNIPKEQALKLTNEQKGLMIANYLRKRQGLTQEQQMTIQGRLETTQGQRAPMQERRESSQEQRATSKGRRENTKEQREPTQEVRETTQGQRAPMQEGRESAQEQRAKSKGRRENTKEQREPTQEVRETTQEQQATKQKQQEQSSRQSIAAYIQQQDRHTEDVLNNIIRKQKLAARRPSEQNSGPRPEMPPPPPPARRPSQSEKSQNGSGNGKRLPEHLNYPQNPNNLKRSASNSMSGSNSMVESNYNAKATGAPDSKRQKMGQSTGLTRAASNPDANANANANISDAAEPKRKYVGRGRPRKYPVVLPDAGDSTEGVGGGKGKGGFSAGGKGQNGNANVNPNENSRSHALSGSQVQNGIANSIGNARGNGMVDKMGTQSFPHVEKAAQMVNYFQDKVGAERAGGWEDAVGVRV